jgi:hypothetical protein
MPSYKHLDIMPLLQYEANFKQKLPMKQLELFPPI